MMKNVRIAAAALALTVLASAAQATVIYNDGATDPVNGQYNSVGSVSADLTSPAGTTTISFDLFGTGSVDGYGNGWDDLYSVAVNGATVFEGYFDLGGGGSNYVMTNTLGWTASIASGGSWQGGIVSVSGLVDLIAGVNTFTVSFTSPGGNNGGGQPKSDESWALNNLDVAPVPLPAALPMLGLALMGLGLLGRKKARKPV